MAEGSIDAMILISISWQALKRAELGDESTRVCNCTVVLVFACFFIEANLNRIIEKMGMEKEMIDFLGNEHPGLQEKLAWFYNKFVARDKAATKKQFKSKKIYRKIRRKFTGFGKLYDFRNDVSHGDIDLSIANIEDAEMLRIKAKEIVESLFHIAKKSGVEIPRNITYELAISGKESSSFVNFDTGFRLSGFSSS